MGRVSTLCRTHKRANGVAVVTFARVEYSAAADADWGSLWSLSSSQPGGHQQSQSRVENGAPRLLAFCGTWDPVLGESGYLESERSLSMHEARFVLPSDWNARSSCNRPLPLPLNLLRQEAEAGEEEDCPDLADCAILAGSNVGSPPEGELVIQTHRHAQGQNANGDIFGGWLTSQMDLGSGILAAKSAQARVVTVAMEGMSFLQPVRWGTLSDVSAGGANRADFDGDSCGRLGAALYYGVKTFALHMACLPCRR